MKTLLILTDGSCLRNPGGPGGWAYLIRWPDGGETWMSGHDPSTTNQRMEIMAAIKALDMLSGKYPCQITIYTDSQYPINTMTKGWRRKANVDLWVQLDEVARHHHIAWRWVKAHNGDPDNARVDRLAYRAAFGEGA